MAKRPNDFQRKASTRSRVPHSLIEISTSDVEEVDDIPLFSIDGEIYSMPGLVPPAIALEALEIINDRGVEAATGFMLVEVLGQDAYDALKSCKAMTAAQLEAIMEAVTDHVLGSMEGVRGN